LCLRTLGVIVAVSPGHGGSIPSAFACRDSSRFPSVWLHLHQGCGGRGPGAAADAREKSRMAPCASPGRVAYTAPPGRRHSPARPTVSLP
jgi:hypothetical protein